MISDFVFPISFIVIPAKAGVQVLLVPENWMPVRAGMTGFGGVHA